MVNSEDPDQIMSHSAASDLGLHCFLRHVVPNKVNKVILGHDVEVTEYTFNVDHSE